MKIIRSESNSFDQLYISYCIQFACQAVEQEKLLEESARELEETIAREESLRKRLEAKEAERLDIEEKYSSLQEEAAGKTRKLKKVWGMYQVRQVLQDQFGEKFKQLYSADSQGGAGRPAVGATARDGGAARQRALHDEGAASADARHRLFRPRRLSSETLN